MKMKLYLCFWLLLLSTVTMAQTSQVSGTIVDVENGEPLPGVNVLVKGTNRGAVTDMDGRFQLEAAENDVLIISYIGYVSQEVQIGNQTQFNISLTPDIQTLSEVVVIGYGTAKKKELTGAVSVVNDEDIVALNPTRVEQALQGQIAGVNITTASGSPGGGLNIRIRGLTTNVNNEPLVLVDGVRYSTDGLAALNPNDIESINILKDATAGIYGVQAANGVVLVTTKKGKFNQKPIISIDGYYGLQETVKKLNLLNAREFAVLKNETFAAGLQAPPYNNTNLGEGTDWQDEVFQTAPIQSYNLSVNGGSEKTTYSIGGSYLDQEGIIGGDKSGYKRYNGRINFVTELIENLTLQSVLLYTHENRNTLPENTIGSVLYNAINASPLDPVRDENGNFTYLMTVNDIINPIAQIENTFNETLVNKIVGKQELAYTFNDNFKLTGRGGYNYAIVDYKSFSPLAFYGTGKAQNTAADADLSLFTTTIGDSEVPVHNNVTESTTSYLDYNLELFLNFNRTFGSHEVKATLGASFFEERGKNLTGVAYNIPYNSWEYADISAADGQNLLNRTSSWQERTRLHSLFGRAEYSYEGRYLLSAILRRDGSSRFGDNYQFGYFPTVSAGWIVTEEDFFDVGVIDFLKVRASYGISGSDKIQNWSYRALLNGEGNYVFDDNLVTGIAIGRLGNADLRWEQTSQANIGLDFNLFDSKVNISTDYFIKKTKDLLLQPEVSGVIGAYGPGSGAPFVNGGNVKNTGFEFLIGFNDRLAKDFEVNASFNLTTFKNEVDYMPYEFESGGAFSVGGNTTSRMQVGFPMGYFIGYETAGVYQNQQQIDERGVTQDGAKPGDLIFVDQDGDNIINFSDNSDLVMLGSPIPAVTMGLNLGASFKGLDFSTNIYSSIGNEIVRNYERQQPLSNLLNYRIGRWTGENSTDAHPRLTTESTRNNVFSDYYVEDGSYIRMKNIQVGYTIPSIITEKAGISRLRIYLSANNLFTITGYKGYDPDFSSGEPLASGIDYGFYPQAKIYMAGINLNF